MLLAQTPHVQRTSSRFNAPGTLDSRVCAPLQEEAKQQEAVRADAAKQKAAAMQHCAKAELDLQEAQDQMSSSATVQV